MIRRLSCPKCRRLHAELPDILVPRKHYAAEVIEDVVDGVSTPDDRSTEDYPCARTMQRWKDWISGKQAQIDGLLRSVGATLPGFGTELLKSMDSLLVKLRERGAGWLPVTTRAIYNSGGRF